MAAVAGWRAFGSKVPDWLRRGLWAPLAAGFCSKGPPWAGQREPGQRPTSAQQRDGIRSIVLSNPKKRNVLSLAMLSSLRSDILYEAESKDLKVIIISAEGPVFSSGHDLKELTDEQGPEYHSEVFQTCSEVMMLIQNHPVPVIAMVNGLATAAGCQLVASCDIAVASDKSSFATPGVNIGLFCSTPGVALGRAVPSRLRNAFNWGAHFCSGGLAPRAAQQSSARRAAGGRDPENCEKDCLLEPPCGVFGQGHLLQAAAPGP
ncbi:enoyl-CoA hydratase domain-containing protein 3, mitochondrial isoform X1 [Pteronotus mesoamericanus]|uniref:enoyl-CoA hydratase domain-containing protein 3, mitochondrial isoform X1 n=1 Tax=Pteronotus mesoamericanus TaxID=1884717 RepID=UPI0023ED62B5|nr:enoyl-CoA hydratase domain-containing protein 3, mitochondrial isoform X1 [Pteronotus parnellii mesoamericanus]